MQGTSQSPEERAAERAAARRTATYGLVGALVGALIGGLGSTLGSYLTNKAHTETHAEDVKVAAYGRLAADTQGYRGALNELSDAVEAAKPQAYLKSRTRVIRLGEELYTSAATVYILSDDRRVVDTAVNITAALFKDLPPLKMGETDAEHWAKIAREARSSLRAFLRAARQDVSG